jgi:long-chain acyl-CoA synthetase
MRLIEVLDRGRRNGPEHEAIVCGTVRLSHADLSERVDRLATAFVALGLGAGARVAVLSTNCHRYFESYWRRQYLGRCSSR